MIMKNVQKFVLAIVLITVSLFASGQSNTDIKQILSKPETRKTIMETIANDSIMSKEMMTVMMNSRGHKMMMMEACKGDTSMMRKRMSNMIQTCKGDTTRVSSNCKAVTGNPAKKEMMQNRMECMNKAKCLQNH
jgi:hypothetical protein